MFTTVNTRPPACQGLKSRPRCGGPTMTGRTGAFSSSKQYRCQTGVSGKMGARPPCPDGRGRPLGPPRERVRRDRDGPPSRRPPVPKPLIYRGGAFPVAATAAARGPAPVGPGSVAGRERPVRKIPPHEMTVRGRSGFRSARATRSVSKRPQPPDGDFFCPGSMTRGGAPPMFFAPVRGGGEGPPRRPGKGATRPWRRPNIGPPGRPRKSRFSPVRALTRRSKYFLTSGED